MHDSDKKSLNEDGPLERYQALHLIQVDCKQTASSLIECACPFVVLLYGYGVIQHTLPQIDHIENIIKTWKASDQEWIGFFLGVTNHWVSNSKTCLIAGKSGQLYYLDSKNYHAILDLNDADQLIEQEVQLT